MAAAPLAAAQNRKPDATTDAFASAIDQLDRERAPAPTVHITIGRVEVRANIATPPAAPRPRTASKPTLSLGDYLKRGGGAS